jgi:general stress protein 26
MKIVNARTDFGPMSEAEVDSFLESKLNIQLATIDEMGDPNIQPLWFYFDRNSNKLYVTTGKTTKKVQNIRRNPNKIYFSVDDEKPPMKGVKGKAKITIFEDPQKILPIAEKIYLKYLGTLDHPDAKRLLEYARNGDTVLLEINPRFFSAWDLGKTLK